MSVLKTEDWRPLLSSLGVPSPYLYGSKWVPGVKLGGEAMDTLPRNATPQDGTSVTKCSYRVWDSNLQNASPSMQWSKLRHSAMTVQKQCTILFN